MATSDITFTQFQTELGALKTAMESSEFNTARLKLALARATLAGLFSSQSTDGRAFALQQEKVLSELSAAIDLAERAASGGGATQLVPVQFGRPR